MAQSADRITPYHRILFALICVATVFEGFDTKLASLVLPFLGDEFDAGPAEVARVLAILGLGTVAAFPIVSLADRLGRRPVFLGALAGYALLTLATFLAESLPQFTALQFGARIFMVTELAIAFVILSEELPARVRGRANGLLGSFASVGAALPAAFLAPLEHTAAGWRGLFLLGALPLLLMPVLIRVLREPPAFERPRAGLLSFAADLAVLLRPPFAGRFASVTAIWFTLNFWSSAAMFFFTYYVFNERGWTASDLQWVPLAAVPFAFASYAAGGWLADALGRRAAMTLFLALGSGVAVACYQATGYWTIAACWVGLQMLQGVWPIAHTITAECFPTEVRAAAGGLSHNMLGRWGLVLGPIAVGTLAERLGSIGGAVTALALVNLTVVPIVWLGLPETRGISIEGIDADLGGDFELPTESA